MIFVHTKIDLIIGNNLYISPAPAVTNKLGDSFNKIDCTFLKLECHLFFKVIFFNKFSELTPLIGVSLAGYISSNINLSTNDNTSEN